MQNTTSMKKTHLRKLCFTAIEEVQNVICVVEFNVLLSEIELGKSRSEALRNMSQRIKAAEFDRFVSAIVYSLESGTAIIDVMQLQSDEVRRLRFSRLEQEIAKVPSKMIFPIVICIVPSMFIMVLVPLILKVKELGIFQAIFK